MVFITSPQALIVAYLQIRKLCFKKNELLGESNTANRAGSQPGSFDFISWTPWWSWCSPLTACLIACVVTLLLLCLTYCLPFAYPYLWILDNFGFDAESIFWILTGIVYRKSYIRRGYIMQSLASYLGTSAFQNSFRGKQWWYLSIKHFWEKKMQEMACNWHQDGSFCLLWILRSPEAIECDNCYMKGFADTCFCLCFA